MSAGRRHQLVDLRSSSSGYRWSTDAQTLSRVRPSRLAVRAVGRPRTTRRILRFSVSRASGRAGRGVRRPSGARCRAPEARSVGGRRRRPVLVGSGRRSSRRCCAGVPGRCRSRWPAHGAMVSVDSPRSTRRATSCSREVSPYARIRSEVRCSGCAASMITDTRRRPSRWASREPCRTIHRPSSAANTRLGRAAVLAQHLTRDDEHARRRCLDGPTQVGEPSRCRGCRRLDSEPLVEHHQTRRVRKVGLACLPEQQAVPRTDGEGRRHAADQLDVLAGESRSTSLAVETYQAPGLTVRCPQREEQLLVAPERLHLLVELPGELRPARRSRRATSRHPAATAGPLSSS